MINRDKRIKRLEKMIDGLEGVRYELDASYNKEENVKEWVASSIEGLRDELLKELKNTIEDLLKEAE